jgi:hypothetical protein
MDPVNDKRMRLEALRDLLTDRVNEADVQYVAPLARQLQAVIAELAAIEPVEKVANVLDDLKARRVARRATPSGGVVADDGSGVVGG